MDEQINEVYEEEYSYSELDILKEISEPMDFISEPYGIGDF